jgi:hypothetical protein
VVNLSGIQPGMYFLRIAARGKGVSYKIVKL